MFEQNTTSVEPTWVASIKLKYDIDTRKRNVMKWVKNKIVLPELVPVVLFNLLNLLRNMFVLKLNKTNFVILYSCNVWVIENGIFS